MSAIQRVRGEARDTEEKEHLYRGHAPTDTYASLVQSAFDDVSKTMNHARHCSYQELYHPQLGDFRQKHSYTSLAPSLCINKPDRLTRNCVGDYSKHKSYAPKRGEWLVLASKNRHSAPPPRVTMQPNPHMDRLAPAGPSRYYNVSADNTRYENFALYWHGRESGVRISAPFLNYDDYRPMEDRRYHRLFWAPDFINITPTCRHGRALMLSAY